MSDELGRYGRHQVDEDAYAEAVQEEFLESARRGERPALEQQLTVQADGVVWLAVHGYLSLALRHPGAAGPSAALVQEFVTRLGEAMIDWEILTSDELALHQRAEGEERAALARCEQCGCTEDAPCLPDGCGWNPDLVAQGRRVCTRCAPISAGS